MDIQEDLALAEKRSNCKMPRCDGAGDGRLTFIRVNGKASCWKCLRRRHKRAIGAILSLLDYTGETAQKSYRDYCRDHAPE